MGTTTAEVKLFSRRRRRRPHWNPYQKYYEASKMLHYGHQDPGKRNTALMMFDEVAKRDSSSKPAIVANLDFYRGCDARFGALSLRYLEESAQEDVVSGNDYITRLFLISSVEACQKILTYLPRYFDLCITQRAFPSRSLKPFLQRGVRTLGALPNPALLAEWQNVTDCLSRV